MVVLWILGGLVCLIVLVCCIPITATAVYDKEFDLTVKIAFISIKPLEKKEKTPEQLEKEKQKKAAKEAKKTAKAKKKPKKERPKPTFHMVRSGVETLLPTVLKTLERLGKGLRFQPFQATFAMAGADDPASAAILYGKANALLWSVMPQLEQVGHFKNVGLGLRIDYQARSPVATCHIGVRVTVGRAFAIGAGLAVPAVQWYQAYQKEHTIPEPAEKAAA